MSTKAKLTGKAAELSGTNDCPAPPAPDNNLRTMTHGGKSKGSSLVARNPQCYELIAAGCPFLNPDGSLPAAYQPLALAAAGELARYLQCEEYVERKGMFDRKGNLNPAAEHQRKTAKGLAELLAQLGMSPRSAAALGLDLKRAQNFDLARFWAEQDAKP